MAYDLFFLSYNEPNAADNWHKLKSRFLHAKRVEGIQGIHSAHKVCAKRCLTSHFFVVDADSEILDFDFTYKVSDYDKDYVHLWYAMNPVNGLEYGWGGLKLFPRKLVANSEVAGVDLTTSFPLKVIPETVSITHFNSTPFDAWRSAFREAVKLFAQRNAEAKERLLAWETKSTQGQYAEWVQAGVRDGVAYAAHNHKLFMINDWQWLQERFDNKQGKLYG
jgi:phytoene dehydrogenase-like protein